MCLTDLNFPRTTLFVIDKDTWINSKAIAERFGYASVSEYIFNLLKNDQSRQLSFQNLLLELEKYYEMDYYTLELVAEKTDLPLRIVIALMNELQLPLPEEKSFSHAQRIHEELVRHKLLPREIESIISLKKEFENKGILSNFDMLVTFFPNEEERTLEVLTRTREILLGILERDLEVRDQEKNAPRNFCNLCNQLNSCRFADSKRIFHEFGLRYDEELFTDDPILERLKKCNAENLFGRFVQYSSVELIKKELKRIDEFRLGQIILVPLPEIKRQQEKIAEEEKELEKELGIYLKCVASVNNHEKASDPKKVVAKR
jgi:hypothetical protein